MYKHANNCNPYCLFVGFLNGWTAVAPSSVNLEATEAPAGLACNFEN